MAHMGVDAQLVAARTALEAAGLECVVSDTRTDVQRGCHGERSEFDTVRGWVLREAVTNVVRHAQAHPASSRSMTRFWPSAMTVVAEEALPRATV